MMKYISLARGEFLKQALEIHAWFARAEKISGVFALEESAFVDGMA
jgi:hypothetical protein